MARHICWRNPDWLLFPPLFAVGCGHPVCLLDEVPEPAAYVANVLADAALCRVKRSGRDCIYVQSPMSEEPASVY